MENIDAFIEKFRKSFKFFYHSNIFFRDIHYTIVHDTRPKGQNLHLTGTEQKARELVNQMIGAGIISPISDNAFRVIDTKYQPKQETAAV
ncbi:MAG: hypothetical protein IT279_11950 [Ignavibacteriaceae bacterium]|nr:hypothetical protein [Ignavibacteriaceae bacterium]